MALQDCFTHSRHDNPYVWQKWNAYAPVICKSGSHVAEDSMDIARLKCNVLSSTLSPKCRGNAVLSIPCPNWPGLFRIYLPGFEQGFWQGFDHRNIPTVLDIYLGFAKREVNIPAIP